MIKFLSILLTHEKKSLKENTEAKREKNKKTMKRKNTEARTRVDQGNVTRLQLKFIVYLMYNEYILYFI